jgi:trehalose 6-phosphate synthase
MPSEQGWAFSGSKPAPRHADSGSRGRLVVVANRLPVTRTRDGAGWETSPGGLVSALVPILQNRDGAWVGWPGESGEGNTEAFTHEGIRLRPVAMTEDEVRDFYQGFANTTLWPLYHDAVRWPEFHRHWWWPYVAVNERYARASAEALSEGDSVWVHDYHLQLVPRMLRYLRPDVRIGFFLHIPFPPVELFAQIPWRTQILEGLLGADTIGFQTKNGALNFVEAAKRFTAARGSGSSLELDGHNVRVEAFPISIDVKQFEDLARLPEVQAEAQGIRESFGPGRKILLGVDRLDYTKGIDHRLRAFETLLSRGEQDPETAVFLQIAVPSRELVPEYAEMRTKIEQLVGRINGKYGTPDHVPVHYMYRGLSAHELAAYYTAADVMVVTPLRDGMNLVAKEYVTTRIDERGVLVLSEFAGAARELSQALLINPHDVDGTAAALQCALEMPVDETQRRMAALRRTVGRYDVQHWADTFLATLTN